MRLEEYKSGTFRQQFQYRSFQPSLVNHLWQWDEPQIDTLLAEANRRLGELNGLSLIVPDLDRFIQMHVVKEAQTSSRIEGTRTGMDEAIQDDPAEIEPEKRDDWKEVRNYIEAMNQSVAALAELPLSNRLLCNAHRILMQGARGETKSPGEFRRSQNWIGGATIDDAVFVPPHHEDVPEFMGDLENFWHNAAIHVPELIRIGITHYQFETVHPFLDGNGRIGRLLITLYLVDKKLLQHPCLYISDHLERNRTAYYDALERVRRTSDLEHWLRFFLVAVIETAKRSTETFQEILRLRGETTEKLGALGQKGVNAGRIVDYLYAKPFATSKELSTRLEMSQTTTDRMLAELVKLDIVREATGNKRNRIFYFHEYYMLFLRE